MSKLVLGLDIGVSSVGYGIIDVENSKIVDYGVRLFEEGKASENETRRKKRGSRRLNRRRKTRRDDLEKLLKQLNVIDDHFQYVGNPYDLRIKGLTEKLNGNELATALFHICKHRGSSIETVEENEAKAKEMGATKEVLAENDFLLKQGKYVCQIQKQRLEQEGKIRGHHNNFRTSDYIKELTALLAHQDLSEETKEEIIKIIARRRKYYEGPGGINSPTPYGRFTTAGQTEPIDLIDKMRGDCSLFPEKLRAPKLSYSAELFNLLNDLNNLSIHGEKITLEQKQDILKFVHEKGKITPKQLGKKLEIDLNDISGFRINNKGEPLLSELTGYKIIKDIFVKNGLHMLVEEYFLYDEIAEILTKVKGMAERAEKIMALDQRIGETAVQELAQQIKFAAYHSLSFEALRIINEEMLKTEMNQMEVIALFNLKQENQTSVKGMKHIVADDTAILSPVAKRAQREAFKVVNRLREIYGEFDSIVVETTRAKNTEDEKKIIREQQKYFEERNRKAEAAANGARVNDKLREKLILYEEQQGKSAYSLEPIDLNLLISDPNAYEVDHIIPRSISLDDSITNKVLITHRENRDKKNLTPIVAFLKGEFSKGSLEEYKSNCIALKKANAKTNKGYRKKVEQYLLCEKDIYKYDVQKAFINRNLVDTSYASRVVFNTLSNYFKQNEIGTKVFTVKGSLTGMLRRKIKLKKDRNYYDHHAIDALLVASMPKMRLLNTIFSRYKIEDIYNDETGEVFSTGNDSDYKDDQYFAFIAHLKNVKVKKFSYKVDTKANRRVAVDTIYSTRLVDGVEKTVKKYKDIYDPKFTALAENILNDTYKERYLMAVHDPNTFEEIVQIVKYYFEALSKDPKYFTLNGKEIKIKGINPLAAYKEEHGMIKKSSKKGNGPLIKQMKYFDGALGSHIDISHNYKVKNKKVVLQKISSYRTDFYYSKEKGYKFVTIRYSDIKWIEKKQKYVICPLNNRTYEDLLQEKGIDETFSFQFSMHHDELIAITKKPGKPLIYFDEKWYEGNFNEHDGSTPEILKFTATNDDKANVIEVKPLHCICSKQLKPTIGRDIVKLEKYATDPVGNLYKIKNQVLKLEFD